MNGVLTPDRLCTCSRDCRRPDATDGDHAERSAVFWHSLVLASLVGLVVLIYAYVAPWVVPG